MRFQIQKYSVLTLLPAILITGLTVYFILNYFLIPVKFTLPISVLISILSFGLTRYYSESSSGNFVAKKANVSLRGGSEDRISYKDQSNLEKYIPNMIFTLIYSIFLILVFSFSNPNLDIIYTTWGSLELSNAVELGIGIILVFFIPGYAIVTLLTRKDKINSLLKVLLSYLSSMLISGLTIYISSIYSSSSSNSSELRDLLISVNLAILLAFVVYTRTYKFMFTIYRNYHYIPNYAIFNIGNKVRKIKANFNELLVFGSIFGLLILYMYFVYGGITIGDQWYHQNRAILIMSGHFKETVLSDWDEIYPPFQSALLAAATVLSGTPLVNTYASIAFLNMTTVFAFYYFISTWLPLNMKRAALIATSLFVIASGFDWTYILDSTGTSSITPTVSSITTFFQEQVRSSDIIYAPNFIIAAFPDFSTGLIYISLPAGFVLLGLIYFEMKNKFRYTVIISITTILGILSHPEFYIFIIISSILPVIFSMKEKNSVYLALLFAFAFAYMIDAMLPVDYLTGNKILGIPLINLAIIFILIAWAIYAIQQNLYKYRHLISFWKIGLGKRLNNYTTRTSSIPKIVLVWVFVYLYAFSFVVWTQLPPNYIDVHRDGKTTPWYFYPMRLGVVGLIGLAYVLSYIFKRFEKEVFVFGIIAIVAFLIGPFYDEQRMTKYIMAGVIGWASLLIYKMLTFIATKDQLVYGTIIAVVVLAASLSTLMFVGYNALIIQTQDYSHALGRRNFPSMQEMNMLELIRSNIQAGSNATNIAALPYEYNPWEGNLITKLHAFSGLPLAKTYPSSLILNTSAVESFYSLLETSNTKYIIIPANSINDGVLSYPTRFALENFQRIYNDTNYQVLKVPSLKGPSQSNAGIGIIYEPDSALLPKESNGTALRFDNNVFDINDSNNNSITVKNVGGIEKVTLDSTNDKNGITLWSNKLDTSGGINYIETMIRLLGENKIGDQSGLKWTDNGIDYFLYLTNEGLKLSVQSNGNETLFVFTNMGVEKNNWIPYQVSVASLENSINVYVNNLLKIKIPKLTENKNASHISKVGIYSANNAVEFGPMRISKISTSGEIHDKMIKYDYYYPLSSLALSGIGYESFANDDFSVLSKKAIIVPFDRAVINDTILKKYIEYARSGGTLIVMNSDDNFNGKFSKLFSIESSDNKTRFDYLKVHNGSSFMKVSGAVENITMKPSSDTIVTASYVDKNNNAVAPLTVEKHFPNGGKIILLNTKGYFDAIQNDSTKYFPSLADFYKFFDLPENNANASNEDPDSKFHFIGNANVSGTLSVKGHTLSVINESTSYGNMDVKEISISDNKGKLKNHFKNVSVINMNLYDGSEIIIDAIGNLTLPSHDSHYDYIGMSIPNGFNMTINLPANENSKAQFVTKNNSLTNHIEINGGSKIQFYNISNPILLLNSLPVLIKSPEITVNGSTSFDNTNYFGQMARIKDTSLDISGIVKIKLHFTDEYNERYFDGIRTQDITYIDLSNIDGKVISGKNEIKIPGDISISAKQQGLSIPIFDIFISSTNIVALGSVSALITLLSWFLRRKRVL